VNFTERYILKFNQMKELIKVISVAMIVAIAMPAFGQQEPHFTQYSDNMLFVNPAYAGSGGVFNLTDIHREQWVGFDGRPVSTTLSAHTPLTRESIGVGLTMVSDKTGPIKQTMFYGDYSYTIKVNRSGGKLSFGIKAGMNVISVATSGLQTTDASDPNLIQNARNNINPNFGFGMYYHSPRFFIGGSSPKMIERSYDGISASNIERRHFFGIAGGVIPLNRDWKLRPTTLVKFTSNSPVSIDASVAGIYKEKLWLGAMYRLNAAFGVFTQFQITPQFKLGIATDFGTQAIRNYNYGTYEVLVSYDFKFKKEGLRSPRFF
jgi:type IX secretion system PorP/SprF family membrane protein